MGSWLWLSVVTNFLFQVCQLLLSVVSWLISRAPIPSVGRRRVAHWRRGRGRIGSANSRSSRFQWVSIWVWRWWAHTSINGGGRGMIGRDSGLVLTMGRRPDKGRRDRERWYICICETTCFSWRHGPTNIGTCSFVHWDRSRLPLLLSLDLLKLLKALLQVFRRELRVKLVLLNALDHSLESWLLFACS